MTKQTKKHNTTLKKSAYLFLYTGCFVLLFITTYHSFFEENRDFVWRSDGLGQYIVNLNLLYSNIINSANDFFATGDFSIPTYSFSIGIGDDILSTYFVSITEYLFILLKRVNIQFSYNAIIVIKMFAAGLSFQHLCKYWKVSPLSAILSSLIYVFSGFTMYYGTRHPQFIMPLILIPLLIVAFDKVIHGRSPISFILLVFYSAWLDYYFLYMNTIILAVYYCVLFVCSKEKNIQTFIFQGIKYLLYYILGIAIAIIPFIAKVSEFINSPRGSSAVRLNTLISYGWNNMMKFFTSLFTPYTQGDYLETYMLCSIPIIIFPGITLFLLNKEEKNKQIKLLFALFTLFYFFPFFGFVFSGFNAPLNRWAYSFLLLLCFIFSRFFDKILLSFSKKQLIGLIATTIVYIIVTCIEYIANQDKVALVPIPFLIISIVIFTIINRTKNIKKYVSFILLFVILLTQSWVNGDYVFSKSKGNFVSEFLETDSVIETFNNHYSNTANSILDDSFHRTELFSTTQHTAGFSKFFQYNGTSVYDSTNNKYVVEYYESIRNAGQLTVANYYNCDNRAYLETLQNNKYFIVTRGYEAFVPYGYSYFSTYPYKNRDDDIYINDYCLPFGYTYESYITEEQYYSLSILERQEALLQSAVIPYSISDILQKQLSDLDINSKPVSYNTETENATISDNTIIVEKDRAKIKLSFEPSKNSETYLYIKDFNIDNVTGNSFDIFIEVPQTVNKGIWVTTSNDIYKLNNDDYLVNLGYLDEGISNCSIILPYEGTYHFEEISILTQSMEQFPEQVKKLSGASLQNVCISNNSITGDIEANTSKILCFNIPYKNGWKAFIDGNEVELFRMNIMSSGLILPPGKHKIKLEYTPPILVPGIIISGLGIIVLIIIILYWHTGLIKNIKRRVKH